MPGTLSFLQQSFPGKAKFTAEDVPDLKNKVSSAAAAQLVLKNAAS
jgi:hypothetical protein